MSYQVCFYRNNITSEIYEIVNPANVPNDVMGTYFYVHLRSKLSRDQFGNVNERYSDIVRCLFLNGTWLPTTALYFIEIIFSNQDYIAYPDDNDNFDDDDILEVFNSNDDSDDDSVDSISYRNMNRNSIFRQTFQNVVRVDVPAVTRLDESATTSNIFPIGWENADEDSFCDQVVPVVDKTFSDESFDSSATISVTSVRLGEDSIDNSVLFEFDSCEVYNHEDIPANVSVDEETDEDYTVFKTALDKTLNQNTITNSNELPGPSKVDPAKTQTLIDFKAVWGVALTTNAPTNDVPSSSNNAETGIERLNKRQLTFSSDEESNQDLRLSKRKKLNHSSIEDGSNEEPIDLKIICGVAVDSRASTNDGSQTVAMKKHMGIRF